MAVPSPTPAISAVTTEWITSYGLTVKNLVQAYRAGGERMADFMEARWANALAPSRDQLSAEMRRQVKVAHAVVGSVYFRGLEFTTASADAVVDKMVELAQQGVRQVAANAAQFEGQPGVAALDQLAQVVTPVAVAATQLVNQIEENAGEWARQIAGAPAFAAQPAMKRPSAFAKARARRTG